MTPFGEHIKELRIKKGLLQKQVSEALSIDMPMLSKIEHGERKAKREHVAILSNLFKVSERELESLWLADKILETIYEEKNGQCIDPLKGWTKL